MRWIVTIVGLLVVVGGLFAVKGAQIGRLIAFGKQAEADGFPPEAVATALAEEAEWDAVISAVGNVATIKGVALSTDVAGVVTRIRFDSGAAVKQGDVVVELDTSVERAQLGTAVARRKLAETTVERTRKLAGTGAITQAQVDADEAALQTAATEVETIQAQIAKKAIRAPFAGTVGLRSVNLGQYLQPGTPVAVLETSDALKVDFALPQQRLGEVAVGMPVRVSIEGVKEPLAGTIGAIDPTIDPTTRSVRLRADVPAAPDALRAGMFVQVAVLLPQKSRKVIVPATAIHRAPYGDSVFIVEERTPDAPGRATTPDGKPIKVARQQFVKLGPARGDFIAVDDGLAAKQEVVTEGAFKLRNHAPIVVDNTKKMTPELAPRPENR